MPAWATGAWFTTAWFGTAWALDTVVPPVVDKPQTTAGGGRKQRIIRSSRAMSWEPTHYERHEKEINKVRQELNEKAQTLLGPHL